MGGEFDLRHNLRPLMLGYFSRRSKSDLVPPFFLGRHSSSNASISMTSGYRVSYFSHSTQIRRIHSLSVSSLSRGVPFTMLAKRFFFRVGGGVHDRRSS
jgi:hypothetical protein